MTARVLAGAIAAIAVACAAGPPVPVAIDTATDTCSHCRMVISSRSTAAQVVAPGEEPLLFDDLGCLREYLAATALPPRAAVFVASHLTGAWVRAGDAVFTEMTGLQTPMGSGLIAHANRDERDADPAAAGGRAIGTSDALGRVLP